MQVLERGEELPGDVVCVSFAEPPMLAAYERGLGLPVRLLGDPERALYDAFGFGRASFARTWLDPRVWRAYAGLVARGRRPERPEQDTRQLGGDAVLDAEGRVRWIYRSEGPEDRPAVDAVVAAASGV